MLPFVLNSPLFLYPCLLKLFRLANKAYLKVADLAALEGDYYKAIENYEKVARSSVSNNLMKWSVKDYFLKAGICLLANNVKILIKMICSLHAF